MESKLTKARQFFLIAGCGIGWFAVIFQFYLIILNRTTSVVEAVLRFFGFFTILTNVLVALCFSLLLFRPFSKAGNFFAKPSTLTAVAVYIAVVGIIYNVILRFLWTPQGLQYIVDELLHSIIPLWFLLYWMLFVPKETLQWRHVFPWLIYPAVYCIYSLIRGAVSGYYPYPFIDVNVLGYEKVSINIAGIVFIFLFLSLMLVGVAKIKVNKKSAKLSR